MTSIPDINVLIYAVDVTSRFHEPCTAWLNSALRGPGNLGFTWQSIAGFVRLGVSPKVMARPMSCLEVFGYLEAWLKQPASSIIQPRPGHLATFRRLLEQAGTTGSLTSDANLAAFALNCGGEIVSCDTDFGRFKGLRWFNPVTRQVVIS